MIHKRILVLVVLVLFVISLGAPMASANDFADQTKRAITVTSPQGGQVLYSGDQASISWNYTGDISGSLFLHLVHRSGDTTGNGLFNVVISSNVPAGSGGYGSYNWIVPDVPTGYTYTVQLSTNKAGVGASSQNFTIAEMVTVKPKEITTSPVKQKPGDLEKLDPQPEPPMRKSSIRR